MRIFTARYPGEVAGIVLVDSTHPDQEEPAMMRASINRAPQLVRRLACFAMPVAINLGIVRFSMRNIPVSVPSEFRGENGTAASAIRSQRVKGLESEAMQGCAATKGGTIQPDKGSGNPEVDKAAEQSGQLGNLPLIVLTAGQYWKPDDPDAAHEFLRFHTIWVTQLQADLARLSSRGRQIVVAESDHSMPANAPGAVSAAIVSMVGEMRSRH